MSNPARHVRALDSRMNYRLDLPAGTTWREFREVGRECVRISSQASKNSQAHEEGSHFRVLLRNEQLRAGLIARIELLVDLERLVYQLRRARHRN